MFTAPFPKSHSVACQMPPQSRRIPGPRRHASQGSPPGLQASFECRCCAHKPAHQPAPKAQRTDPEDHTEHETIEQRLAFPCRSADDSQCSSHARQLRSSRSLFSRSALRRRSGEKLGWTFACPGCWASGNLGEALSRAAVRGRAGGGFSLHARVSSLRFCFVGSSRTAAICSNIVRLPAVRFSAFLDRVGWRLSLCFPSGSRGIRETASSASLRVPGRRL